MKERDAPINHEMTDKPCADQLPGVSQQELHKSVLLDEALAWWCSSDIANAAVQRPVFIDATFGRGGHSSALLASQPESTLLVFDKDPTAIAAAHQLQAKCSASKIHVIHDSFAQLQLVVQELGYFQQVQGILMDLGVSSPQLDEAERGFSFMRDGPLDMRMDTSQGQTAAQWLSVVDEKTLADVLYQLGEEKQSRRIARKIVEARAIAPIETTSALADLVCQVVSRRAVGKHPATRTFQAIRMYINAELADLQQGLEAAFASLAIGGRLVVLSFHSLEDRIVKQFMQRYSKPAELPRGLPIKASEIAPPAQIKVKNQKPTTQEVLNNPRARSAILRVMEKVAEQTHR